MDMLRWIVEIVFKFAGVQGFRRISKTMNPGKNEWNCLTGVGVLVKGLRTTFQNLGDFYLHSNDSYYGQTTGMIFVLLRLLKHSLSSTLAILKNLVSFIRQNPWLFGKYFFHIIDDQ
jgi:hypothetical protein